MTGWQLGLILSSMFMATSKTMTEGTRIFLCVGWLVFGILSHVGVLKG